MNKRKENEKKDMTSGFINVKPENFSESLWFDRHWPRRLEMASSCLRSIREAHSGNHQTRRRNTRPILKTWSVSSSESIFEHVLNILALQQQNGIN